MSQKGRAKKVMKAKRITAAPLYDGRLQLWGIFDDELFSCWKTTTNPDSAWTDWQHFPQPSHNITYINALHYLMDDFSYGVFLTTSF